MALLEITCKTEGLGAAQWLTVSRWYATLGPGYVYEAFLILAVWFMALFDFVILWVTLVGMLLWALRS